MEDREYTLVEIARDPGAWVYEAYELTKEGHYYLFMYDSGEEVFYRATVPAGAAAVQFFPLDTQARVPIGGWRRVERKSMTHPRPKLVKTVP